MTRDHLLLVRLSAFAGSAVHRMTAANGSSRSEGFRRPERGVRTPSLSGMIALEPSRAPCRAGYSSGSLTTAGSKSSSDSVWSSSSSASSSSSSLGSRGGLVSPMMFSDSRTTKWNVLGNARGHVGSCRTSRGSRTDVRRVVQKRLSLSPGLFSSLVSSPAWPRPSPRYYAPHLASPYRSVWNRASH